MDSHETGNVQNAVYDKPDQKQYSKICNQNSVSVLISQHWYTCVGFVQFEKSCLSKRVSNFIQINPLVKRYKYNMYLENSNYSI